MAVGTQEQTGNMQGRGSAPRRPEGFYDQASEAMSGMADRASEMWDETYDQGARYFREGSRALTNVEGSTIAMLIVGASLGYAIAWLIHGEGWNRSQHFLGYDRPQRGRHGRVSRH